jgi:hypothetical protein
MDSLEFTGFELGTKGGNGEASLAREIERERRQSCSLEGEGTGAAAGGRRSTARDGGRR